MPYQVFVKRKDGTVRTDFGVALDQPPSVGDEISYSANDQTVTAKVTAIRKAPVGAELDIIDADEI